MTEQEILKREKELNEYKDKLVSAHTAIKEKTDLLNGLHEMGIKSADELNKVRGLKDANTDIDKQVSLLDNTTKPEKAPEEDVFGAGFDPSAEKIAGLEKKLAKQDQDISQLTQVIRGDRLMSEVRAEIKDKPEYQLLNKGINESVVNGILRQMDADSKSGKPKALAEYLKKAEGDFRKFYTTLGGKIEEKNPNLPFADVKAPVGNFNAVPAKPAAPAPQADGKIPEVPKMASAQVQMPSFGTGAPVQKNDVMDKVKVRHGAIDDDEAFNAHLQSEIPPA